MLRLLRAGSRHSALSLGSEAIANDLLPSTSYSSSPVGYAPQLRGMASVAETVQQSVQGVLDNMIYPEKLNPQERQFVEMYGSAREVMSPYKRPRSQGMEALEDKMYYFWNRFDTIRVCWQSIRGFSSAKVQERAQEVFEEVNEAIASGSITELDKKKHMLVPSLYKQMRGQMVKVPKDVTVDWDVKFKEVKIVDAAFEATVPAEMQQNMRSSLRVAQLTLKFVTEQQFKVTQGGKVVAGSDTWALCEDYWVFERPFFKGLIVRKPGPEGADWRLLARLDTTDVEQMSEEIKKDISTVTANRMVKGLGAGALLVGLYGLYNIIWT